MDNFVSLAELSDDERDKACQKYQIIEPYINDTVLLKTIAKNSGIPIRTLGLWIKNYRSHGLSGLVRQARGDKVLTRQYDAILQKTIEGIYLKKPMLSGANIHTLITEYCNKNNLKVPSYRSVCGLSPIYPMTCYFWVSREAKHTGNNMICCTFVRLTSPMSYGKLTTSCLALIY
ncbi:MAG: helix-turn-helix domain containing protein [Legionella sp.]|uniref:helix-turn-helix domain containing protein n=1 Tax=Legionella sp. TaxID=459 RepID=UPI00285022CF|nr:helix-turn-helix domain containing protein [Legionella sp.]